MIVRQRDFSRMQLTGPIEAPQPPRA
jgi:hypothetical protein